MSQIYQLAAFVVDAKYKSFWGYLIAAWLWALILNQSLVSGFYGITLGSLGLLLGAMVLMRLSQHTQNRVLAVAYAVAEQR